MIPEDISVSRFLKENNEIELIEKSTIVDFQINFVEGVVEYEVLGGEKKTHEIAKIYNTVGYNEDGTMTQKAITEALDNKVSVSFDGNTNTLIFTK